MPEATIPSRRKRALEEQGQNKNAPRMRSAFEGQETERLSAGDRSGTAEHRLLVGHAQIFVRIDSHAVDAHFVVKVRPRGATRLTNIADDLAT